MKKTKKLLDEWFDSAQRSSRYNAREEYNKALAEISRITKTITHIRNILMEEYDDHELYGGPTVKEDLDAIATELEKAIKEDK